MKSAVLVFPGINRERDMARALKLIVRRRAGHGLACRDRAAGGHRSGGDAGRLFLRRLSALRRDRGARADHGRGARPCGARAGWCSASATASRSCARRGCCPGVLMRNASAEIHLPRRLSAGRALRHAVHPRLQCRPGDPRAGRAWRRQLRRRRRDDRAARRRGPGAVPLLPRPTARSIRRWNINGATNAIAGIVNDKRQRARHDAASGEPRRSRPRLRPTGAACSPGWWRSSARRRDVSRRPLQSGLSAQRTAKSPPNWSPNTASSRTNTSASSSLIGREPTLTELGIFSAMWNEHCSYKSSKVHLRDAADQGAVGDPGAGRERRRHRHRRRARGASSRWRATTIRATSSPIRARRPASAASCATSSPWARGRSPASMRSRFGDPKHPKTRHLVSGVVAGIGGYGNSFGVPTVGGQVRFHTRYDGNIPGQRDGGRPRRDRQDFLRGGLRRRHADRLSRLQDRPRRHPRRHAWRRPNSATTPRRSARPCRSAIRSPRSCCSKPASRSWPKGCVIAIQDMGAAGLTCSAVEMGAKGDLGVTLDLDKVPCRETGMSAYEMMLSESQERMLMVLKPEKEAGGRGDLPQMGARLRGRRRDHADASASSCATAAR